MRNHRIIIKQIGSNRHGPYRLNLTQKLHHLTQKFIVLDLDTIYISFRFRQVPDGACAALIEPLELEMKSRLLVLFAYGDLCRVRHGLGNTGYSEDGVDGKNKSLPRTMNRRTGYRWFHRRLTPTGKITAPICSIRPKGGLGKGGYKAEKVFW